MLEMLNEYQDLNYLQSQYQLAKQRYEEANSNGLTEESSKHYDEMIKLKLQLETAMQL